MILQSVVTTYSLSIQWESCHGLAIKPRFKLSCQMVRKEVLLGLSVKRRECDPVSGCNPYTALSGRKRLLSCSYTNRRKPGSHGQALLPEEQAVRAQRLSIKWGHLEAGPSQESAQAPPVSGAGEWGSQTLRALWAVQKGSPTQPAQDWAFPLPPPPALHLCGSSTALPRDRKWCVYPWWLLWLEGLLSGTRWCRITHLTQCRQSLVSGCLCPFSWNSQKFILLQLLHDQNTVFIGLFKCKCCDIFISRPWHS